MSFFDEFSHGVKEAGKAISNTTSSLSGQAKLALEQNRLNGEIEEHYKNIGKKICEARAAGSAEPDLAEEFSAVDTAAKRVREINDEIAALKGCRVCPNCGASVPQDSQFCPSCGTKMPPRKAEQENSAQEQTAPAPAEQETPAPAEQETPAPAEQTESAHEEQETR